MKVLKKVPKPRHCRDKQPLTLELLVHWAYVWLNANNGRFCEPVRVTAPKLHVGKTKVDTLHDALATAGVMHVDAKTVGRDSTGKKKTLAYFVTKPAREVLAFAHYWWTLEEEYGDAPPVRDCGLDRTREKTGSDPRGTEVVAVRRREESSRDRCGYF
jgi:hypothetical protein